MFTLNNPTEGRVCFIPDGLDHPEWRSKKKQKFTKRNNNKIQSNEKQRGEEMLCFFSFFCFSFCQTKFLGETKTRQRWGRFFTQSGLGAGWPFAVANPFKEKRGHLPQFPCRILPIRYQYVFRAILICVLNFFLFFFSLCFVWIKTRDFTCCSPWTGLLTLFILSFFFSSSSSFARDLENRTVISDATRSKDSSI